MYNREYSDTLFPQEKAILAGFSVPQEGLLLSAALENGVEKVRPCDALQGEVVVGFSTMTRVVIDQEVIAKAITVPAAAPYTVDLGYNLLIAGQMRIPGLTLGNPANAGEYSFVAGGIVTFNVAQKGLHFTVFAKRQLTVEEARAKYREGFIGNAQAFEVYDVCGVIEGKGKIFTDRYDVSKDYSAGGLTTGADGTITVGGAGTALPSHIRVIALPTIDVPFLGLEFSF